METTVHKVTSPSQREACHSCGLTNHKANDCRFKEAICHSCGKKGHIKRACKSGKRPQRRGRNGPTPRGRERTKWVDKEQSDEDSDGSVGVHMVGKSSTKPYVWTCESMANHCRWRWKQVLLFR